MWLIRKIRINLEMAKCLKILLILEGSPAISNNSGVDPTRSDEGKPIKTSLFANKRSVRGESQVSIRP